ncbi:hypothetical protein WISP_147147 [Willisornis vidua]|uniref:Uncharacterized protein n=1 Tax=Willisornis vidua TaxID=1566151 RepID=A0ABQ9CKI6_9PASS|nr:hypothetical protein WISP_147147 [Willisornis vidua]
MRIHERNSSTDTQVIEGWGGGAPGTEAEIPLKTMVGQDVSLQPMKFHEIYLQPMDVLTPEQDCTPRKGPTLEQFMKPMGKTHIEVCGGLSSKRGAPCWSGRNVRSLSCEKEGAAETILNVVK